MLICLFTCILRFFFTNDIIYTPPKIAHYLNIFSNKFQELEDPENRSLEKTVSLPVKQVYIPFQHQDSYEECDLLVVALVTGQ